MITIMASVVCVVLCIVCETVVMDRVVYARNITYVDTIYVRICGIINNHVADRSIQVDSVLAVRVRGVAGEGIIFG